MRRHRAAFDFGDFKTRSFPVPAFALAFAAALCPCVASATLGEPEASVQTDGAKFNASIKVTEHPSYRLHEIQLPSGTLLKEFVGADGKVFAVAWSGPRPPDLRQSMGRYFDGYAAAAAAAAAAKTTRSDRSHLQIRTSDLVVQSSGHMRALSGRAYLTQAIPGGVSLGDIR
jgi:hypothetical protein